MAGAAAAIPLRVLPGAPAGEVAVAVTLELVPVVVTALGVCGDVGTLRGPQRPWLLCPLPSLSPKGQQLGGVPTGVSAGEGGRRGSVFPTFLAAAAAVAGQAEAHEGVDLVDAGAAVLAGAGQTVVDVCGGHAGSCGGAGPPPPASATAPQPTVPSTVTKDVGMAHDLDPRPRSLRAGGGDAAGPDPALARGCPGAGGLQPLTDLAVLPGEARDAAAAAHGAVGAGGPAVQAGVGLAGVGGGCGGDRSPEMGLGGTGDTHPNPTRTWPCSGAAAR